MRWTRRSTRPTVLGALALVLGLALAPAASSDAATGEEHEVDSVRLDGATRFQTAAAIATAAFDDASEVVIATGEGFADALAGAALEGSLGAPVLLVPSGLVDGSVPDAVTDAINELGAQRATLLGGPEAISEAVASHLVRHSALDETERIAGPTRFETAARIAERTQAGELPDAATEAFELQGDTAAFLATGLDWPDSMAASPGAYGGGYPILLTAAEALHPAAARGLRASGAEVVVILGGTGVVGQEVARELRDQGYEVVRLAGADRWETATEVAAAFDDAFGYGTHHVGLATGFAFADALASAPYLGQGPAPLTLTPATATVGSAESFFSGRAGEVATLHVFGGTQAVGPSVVDAYRQRAAGPTDDTALAGTVTDAATGDPVAHATVTAEGDTAFAATTDADGAYRVAVNPGTYTVTAEADGYEPASVEGVTVGEGETTDGVDLALDPAGSDGSGSAAIVGTVTSAATGEPIADAEVAASDGDTTTTTTGADGAYRLAVTPDTYTVSVDVDGYEPASVNGVAVGEGETVDGVDFALDRDLRQTVTDGPELARVETAVTSDSHAVVSFIFDEQLDALVDAGAFHLHTADGANRTHTTDPDQPRARLDDDDPAVVRVMFDRQDWDRAVTAGVDAGGVRDGDAVPNPEGGLPLKDVDDDGGTVEAGETPAAELEHVEVHERGTLLLETREAVFTFDEAVDGLGDGARFALYGDDGEAAVVFGGQDCARGDSLTADAEADQVVCETSDSERFPAIDDAVLGGVGAGSVVVEREGSPQAHNHAASVPLS